MSHCFLLKRSENLYDSKWIACSYFSITFETISQLKLDLESCQGIKNIFFSTSGYGLKCYTCSSSTSWDNCNDFKAERYCPARYDRCAKLSVHVESSSFRKYSKYCTTEEGCNIGRISPCKGKVKCKLDCCSGDLCNAATLQKVSVAALIACALMALLY